MTQIYTIGRRLPDGTMQMKVDPDGTCPGYSSMDKAQEALVVDSDNFNGTINKGGQSAQLPDGSELFIVPLSNMKEVTKH